MDTLLNLVYDLATLAACAGLWYLIDKAIYKHS